MQSPPAPGRKPEASATARGLMALADLAWRFPILIVVLGIALCVVSVLYTMQNLTFDPNRANLIRRDPELQRNLEHYLEQFPKAEDMVVVVEDGTVEDRKAFIDDLAAHMRAEPKIFRDVFEKVELPFLRTHALHYLDVGTLRHLGQELTRSLPLLSSLSSSNNMVGLLDSFGGATSGGDPAEALSDILPFLNEALGQLLVSLETRGRYEYRSPWAAAFFGDAAEGTEAPAELEQSAGETVFYNTIADGKLYLLLARPAHGGWEEGTAGVEAAVDRLRELIRIVHRTHPAVQVGLTGEPVLDTDEGRSSTRDSTVSTLYSFLGVALVFALSFRDVFRPMMAVVSLALGVGWTMGFTTLVVGHLNLLTVTFATILIGLGIDFGIHFIYRYDEERTLGTPPLEAMRTTLAGAGAENLTGAVSTAIAFWVLNFTDFVGIAELGTIAGTGILLCFLAMATVLPSFLFLQERWSLGETGAGISRYDTLARMEQAWLARPWLVAALCIVFSLFCAWEARKVRYDYNLLNLQARGLASVQTELHMISVSDRSLLNGISLAETPAEARRLTEAYKKLPTVAAVESVLPMIPEGYPAKKPYLEKITKAMRRVPPPEEEEGPNGGSMARNLQAMAGSFLDLDSTFREAWPALSRSKEPDVRRDAAAFKNNLDRLFSTLESMGPGPIEDGLTTFQKDFFADLRGLIGFLKDQVAAPPVTLRDVPQVLRIREVGRTGAIQVRVFPKENVWERPAMERFVQSLQTVDPRVVGMPVMMYYDTQELRTANEEAGWYALAAIVVLLILHFRSLKIAALALFPKAVGILWMVGIMGYTGVHFNSANFLALPLILGIGLVFGVHVIHRVQEEEIEGVFGHSTGPAIALSALTTMIGFGTMIPATHQGIASLGFVMTVGVGANLLASVLFLPAVLRILTRAGISVRTEH